MSGLVCLNTHARDEIHARKHATRLCAMSMRPPQQTEASVLAVDRRCLSAHMVELGRCTACCLSWNRLRVSTAGAWRHGGCSAASSRVRAAVSGLPQHWCMEAGRATSGGKQGPTCAPPCQRDAAAASL
jgi:hypothetical protein